MKKNFKTMAAALAVTGTMALTMGMGMTAFAAVNTEKDTSSSFTKSGDTVSSDTTSISLIKDYDRANNTQTDSNSPKETFTFTITPYAVWNAGTTDGSVNGTKYAVENIPLLGTTVTPNTVIVSESDRTTTVNITAPVGNAGGTNYKQAISIPEYKSVGDFWYQVVEKDNKTTGVNYATNDASEIDRTYFIHVQVVNGATKGEYLRSVTLHKTAPDKNITNEMYNAATATTEAVDPYYNPTNKVNDIQNTYSAGTLTVKKKVDGNAGDKERRFQVTVTFKKPEGTIINSDITYSAYESATTNTLSENLIIKGQSNDNRDWTVSAESTTKIGAASKDECYAKAVIWLKDDESVVFKNIPYGVEYTVTETDYRSEKYSHSFEFTTPDKDATDETLDTVTAESEAKWSDAAAEGTITDAEDLLTITNTKNVTIDVGVLLSNAPYAAMLALAGTAGVVFVKRRKKDIED